MTNRAIEDTAAKALVAGGPSPAVDRLQTALNGTWRWTRTLARRYETQFGSKTRPRRVHVTAFLQQDRGFQRALTKYAIGIARSLPTARMQPISAAAAWGLPAIESTSQLAEWLCLAPGELEWLANLRDMNSGVLENYHYRAEPKRSGGVRLV